MLGIHKKHINLEINNNVVYYEISDKTYEEAVIIKNKLKESDFVNKLQRELEYGSINNMVNDDDTSPRLIVEFESESNHKFYSNDITFKNKWKDEYNIVVSHETNTL